MRNKKIITLLLAATVAITSVAPTVKASDIILFFDSRSAVFNGLPVKKGTKVTFQLKGNRKYTTKVTVKKLYRKKSNGAFVKVPTKTVRYDYLEKNTKCVMKYSIRHKSTKRYTDYTKKFSNSKKAEKFAKKHNAEIVSISAIGKEKLTVKIKGYGTYETVSSFV